MGIVLLIEALRNLLSPASSGCSTLKDFAIFLGLIFTHMFSDQSRIYRRGRCEEVQDLGLCLKAGGG